MLLRISLIVVILAGLATAGISRFRVADKINTLTTDLETTRSELSTTQNNLETTKKDAAKLKTELAGVKKDLSTATNNLAAMTDKKNEQEERANKHATNLEKALKERTEALQKLAAWEATGLKYDTVVAEMAEKKKITEERDAYAQEKEVLLRNNRRLQADLDKIYNPIKKVEMRLGLKGKVLSVDPKWQFVILDIGADQGALERGEMVVSRSGKLVAKVRLTTVDRVRSVANILPEWKQADVMEGDQVLYFNE